MTDREITNPSDELSPRTVPGLRRGLRLRPVGIALALATICLPGLASAQECASPGGDPIAAIEIEGLEQAPEEEVRKALPVAVGDTVSPLSFIRIENAILETGWFASASVVLKAGDGGCVLRVRVREFARVQEIRFPDVKAFARETLLVVIETEPGDRPNRQQLAADAQRLEDHYHEAGYEAARVGEPSVEDGVVTFPIAEGRIARVEVVGAKRTGARRVRQILGLKKGDLYNTIELIEGQSKLYRTGLFSLVGFGVEPVEDEGASQDIVLTVTVGELENPYSRTEVFTAGGPAGAPGRTPGLTGLNVDARVRNVGAGHSLRTRVDLLGVAPDELARTGFDEYYQAEITAELRLFRPHPAAGGGQGAISLERVKGRTRADLDLRHDVALPSLRVGADIPVIARPDLAGTGRFALVGGWRVLDVVDGGAVPGAPALDGRTSEPWGRGEIGFELTHVVGLEIPARVGLTGGVEANRGYDPFSFLHAEGDARLSLARGFRLDADVDAGTLSGDEIPFWREYAIGGAQGPAGYGPDIAFARHYARGRLGASYSLPRDLLGVGVGWEAAAWGRPAGARTRGDAQSAVVDVRVGPEFARLRGGVALPLSGPAAHQPWWFVGLVIATPY